ncbi:hypothetical protein ACSVIJ_05320 [Pseudomonas sp. NCHU5208]|uniref:hypothetical protein n=1 Tax=unclassified Pseudomonas TaxID=196821 RepID=UPI003F9CCB5E
MTNTTNNPNGLELNQEINRYSSHEPERNAYERMQRAGFKVAEVLMGMPLGTMADIGQGETLFVAPWEGKMDVFTSPDWEDNCRCQDINFFHMNSYEGLSAVDLDMHRVQLETWLGNPVFKQSIPADNAFQVVAELEEWWQKENLTRRGTETPALNRFEHENTKNLIDGYMVPSRATPQESREQQFDRAKGELIAQLERQLEQVKSFSYIDMQKKVS